VAREAKLIITSENKAEAGIKAAARDLLGLDDAAKKIGSSIKAAFTVTAIAAAAKEVVQFGISSVKTFGEMERTMLQLKTALGGNEQSFKRLTGFIDDMGAKTLASKDEIEKLVAELASLGKSDSDIERITEAAVALSNVTGQSLDSAFKAINGTFVGTTKELKKLVPEIATMSAEQLAAGGAVDLLNRKFGEISDKMATGVSQQFKNLGDSVEDLKENFGQALTPIFSPLVDWLNKVAKGWNDAAQAQAGYTAGQRAGVRFDTLASLLKNGLSAAKLIEGIQYSGQGPDEQLYQLREGQDVARMVLGAQSEGYKQFARAIADLQRGLAAGTVPAPPAPAAAGAAPASATAAAAAARPSGSVGFYGLDAGFAEMQTEFLDLPAAAGFADIVSDIGDGLGLMTEKASDFQIGWDNALEQIGQRFQGFDGMVSDMLVTIADGLGDAMMAIGEALYDQESAWEDLGVVAVRTLAQVLKGIGAQLAGLAAVKLLTLDFVGAGIAAVASAAAFAAAGFASAWANDLSSSSSSSSSSSNPGSSPGGGASYAGSQPITFNFYNQGNVVGSGGMQELATIIDGIIKTQARYA
jgi:hypothetical protein